MASGPLALTVLLFVWELFKNWLFIFISPLHKLDLLWTIVPIWLSWFFAEFFQEKRSTSFGNAISNGVIPIFIGIDWIRYLTNMLIAHTIKFSYLLIVKYTLSVFIIAYGLSIILFGIKAKQFVHYYGRIREVTYVLVMFSPIIYNIIEFNWNFLLGVVVFFPVYYFLIELINRIVPSPKIYQYDEGPQPGQQSEYGVKAPTNLGTPTTNLLGPHFTPGLKTSQIHQHHQVTRPEQTGRHDRK